MEEIIDQVDVKGNNSKFKTLAVVGIFVAIILILIHFTHFIITNYNLDSPWFPDYAIKFALKASFISGFILTIGLLINFFLFIIKKYIASIVISLLLVIIYFLFPTLYHSL